jgi:hypothetical protein
VKAADGGPIAFQTRMAEVRNMDRRTPAALKKAARSASRPKIISFSNKTGEEKVRALDEILRDIEAGLRRRGMTAADRSELRKWIARG